MAVSRHPMRFAGTSGPDRRRPAARRADGARRSLLHPDDAAGHDRSVALLAAPHGGRVHAAALPRIAKALAVWRGGDRALAACHLALARLPPVSPDDAYRLFLAGLALDGGVAPATLLREISAPEVTIRLLKYSPAQPRAPAGGPQHGGEWTSGDAASGNEATVQPVANTTRNFAYACKKLKVDRDDASKALHAAKKSLDLDGDMNCDFDLRNGDIFYSGEWIGNLGD